MLGEIGIPIWHKPVNPTPLAPFFGAVFAFLFLGGGFLQKKDVIPFALCNLQAYTEYSRVNAMNMIYDRLVLALCNFLMF